MSKSKIDDFYVLPKGTTVHLKGIPVELQVGTLVRSATPIEVSHD